MNEITYNLLNKINDSRILNEIYLERLYQYYKHGSEILNYKIDIEKKDFKKIINIIYDILRLKISDEKFEIVIEHYLKLLMADANDDNKVDYNWFIKYVWYLCKGTSPIFQEIKDCIPFIQQKLIKEFNVEENLKEKINRKVYTRFMINN